MVTGELYLSLQSISYQLTSVNFVRVTNNAKACFVFGDVFIEFPLKTKLTHQHGHSKPHARPSCGRTF
jgi:hypothetical protein